MSAPSAAGYAADAAPAATARADALTPAPYRAAQPAKPKPLTRAGRGLVATAETARTDRQPFPAVKARTAQVSDVRGSRASTGPSAPRNLFNPSEGISMEKSARVSFCPPLKFVPLAAQRSLSKLILERSRKQLKYQEYTLCEVQNGERQPVPPREPAFLRGSMETICR